MEIGEQTNSPFDHIIRITTLFSGTVTVLSMESLNKIIARLRVSEIQFIKHFYQYRSSKNFEKRKLLFEGIVSGKLKTNEQAMSKLFGKPSASAFSQLKRKCKEEIIELLILHDGAVKSNLKGDKEKFDAIHGLSKVMILQDRGLMDEASVWGERLKKQAVDSENYGAAALVYEQLDNPLLRYVGPEAFEKHQREALQVREAAHESFMAKYQWKKGVLPPSEYLRRLPALNAVGQEVLPEMERKLASIKSNKMAWHYHLLAAEYTLHANKTGKCQTHITELQALLDIEEAPAAEVQIYLTSLRLRLALLNNVDSEVIETAERIVVLFEESNGVALDAMEQCYFSLKEGKKIAQALLICEKIINHESLLDYEKLQCKWAFYKAACQFELGNYADSARTLTQSSLGHPAISGGVIAAGVLEIMCMIEREEYDRLEYRIPAFMKMMRRKSRDECDNNYERVRLIQAIMQKLLKYNFEFKKAEQSVMEPLLLLHSQTGVYAWNKFGLEQIPFHSWLNKKLTSSGQVHPV